MLAINQLQLSPRRCIRPLPALASDLLSQCAPLQSFSGNAGAAAAKKQQPRAANPNMYREIFERRSTLRRQHHETYNQRGGVRSPHRPSLYPPKQPQLPKASNPKFFATTFLEKRPADNFVEFFKPRFRSVAKALVRYRRAVSGATDRRRDARSTTDSRTDDNNQSHDPSPRQDDQQQRKKKPLSAFKGEIKIVADYLMSQGEWVYTHPESTWIRIDNISPISSLEFMIKGIDAALDAEESRGIIDLDQKWQGEDKVQFLPPMLWVENQPKWVRNARLILSPFSRPKGWFMQFDNRSIVSALISHAERTPIQCGYKRVKVSVCKVEPVVEAAADTASEPESESVAVGPQEYQPINEDPNSLLDEKISDHTMRVENCPEYASVMSIVNFFGRYDLMNDKESVKRWVARTTDGRSSHHTFLVHFEGAHWARAALRERQSQFLPLFNAETKYDKAMGPMVLAQYPKQMW
jgi:hypothetical protein